MLCEFVLCVCEFGVDVICVIVEGDEVLVLLVWVMIMMNEVSDAYVACRWILEFFVECDGYELSVNCSW